MQKLIFCFGLSLWLMCSAAARSSEISEVGPDRTEFFWQPQESHFFVQPHFVVSPVSRFIITTATGVLIASNQSDTFAGGLNFGYGLTKTWSVTCFCLTYSQTTTAVNVASTGEIFSYRNYGAIDPTLGLANTQVTPWGLFYFDMNLKFFYDRGAAGSKQVDGNKSSGTFSLAPSIGAALFIGRKNRVGVKLTYQYVIAKSLDNLDGTYSIFSGGDSAIANWFGEFHFNKLYFIPAAAVAKTQSQAVVEKSLAQYTLDSIIVQTFSLTGGYYIVQNLVLALTSSVTVTPQYQTLSAYTRSAFNAYTFSTMVRYEF